MGGSVSSPLTLCTNNIIRPTTTATAMCTPTSIHRVPHVLTVAGIQADLKTCAALGVYCSTVLTAVTAQNTVGVQGIHSMQTFVAAQLRSVLSDMQVDVVSNVLQSFYNPTNRSASVPIVSPSAAAAPSVVRHNTSTPRSNEWKASLQSDSVLCLPQNPLLLL
ncbi:hypothetical protein Sjap_018182 [Stephania japonica]|uniref:Pyridoxamine kinase/Phosphomethylpyrimidine kinase domain-containing protein n=1 Tax=Stephania japonica TaxID=461633 RepID=A0AAP0NJ31_9MAGN